MNFKNKILSLILTLVGFIGGLSCPVKADDWDDLNRLLTGEKIYKDSECYWQQQMGDCICRISDFKRFGNEIPDKFSKRLVTPYGKVTLYFFWCKRQGRFRIVVWPNWSLNRITKLLNEQVNGNKNVKKMLNVFVNSFKDGWKSNYDQKEVWPLAALFAILGVCDPVYGPTETLRLGNARDLNSIHKLNKELIYESLQPLNNISFLDFADPKKNPMAVRGAYKFMRDRVERLMGISCFVENKHGFHRVKKSIPKKESDAKVTFRSRCNGLCAHESPYKKITVSRLPT